MLHGRMKRCTNRVGTRVAKHVFARVGGPRTRYPLTALAIAIVLAIVTHLFARAGVNTELAAFTFVALAGVIVGIFMGARVESLEQHAREDVMTRVGNRRHWDEVLAAELERAVGSRMPMSVLLVDVDHLKELNDAHGHGCGDRALALVGEVLLDTCRSRDVPARVGGDEFAVLLPRTRAHEARAVAERIRLELARRRVELGGPLDRLLTMSIGIADRESAGGSDDLLEAADAALYVAKEDGRDRVVVKAAPIVSGIICLDDARKARQGRASG